MARVQGPDTRLEDLGFGAVRPIGFLVAVFVGSRLVYAAAGIHFDASPLHWYSQFLDVPLLRDHMLVSLFYLHAQPPLFNALLGVVVKSPTATAGTFQALFLAMGLALILSMYLLMKELRVPRIAALVAAALFCVLPSTVIVENSLFYTYPVVVLLSVGMLGAARYLRIHHDADALAASASFAAVALTRATFHIVWLVLVVLVLIVASRRRSRRTLIVLIVPVALVGCWYARGFVLFGATSASTLSGMNIASVDLVQAPPRELQRMVARGELSKQALIPPFRSLDAYHVPLPDTGVPALDRPKKVGGRFDNYNNKAYIGISDRYMADTVRYVRAHPWSAARNFATSIQLYFEPVTVYANCDHGVVSRLCDAEVRFFYGQPRIWHPSPVIQLQPGAAEHAPGVANITWLGVLEYASVLGAGAVILWRRIRRRALGARAITIGLISLTVAWELVFANVFELGENSRFRFETDPITWVASLALLTMAILAGRDRRSSRAGVAAAPTRGLSSAS